MSHRAEAEKYLLEMIQKIDPSGHNAKILAEQFAQLTDAQFEELMLSYEKGEDRPSIYAPNFSEVQLSVERNFAIAKEIGHNFFERLYIGSDDPDTPTYLTPVKYMVLELPVRRQAQILEKGISLAEHHRSIDQRSGQAAGDSATAKVSYPELQILRAMGMEETVTELMKYRGGDIRGFDALNTSAAREGEISLKAISHLAGGVESTKAVASVLTSMHLANSLFD